MKSVHVGYCSNVDTLLGTCPEHSLDNSPISLGSDIVVCYVTAWPWAANPPHEADGSAASGHQQCQLAATDAHVAAHVQLMLQAAQHSPIQTRCHILLWDRKLIQVGLFCGQFESYQHPAACAKQRL